MPLRGRSPGQGRASAKRSTIAEQGQLPSRLHFSPSLPTRGPEFRNRISFKTVTESEFRDSGTESARFLSQIGRCPVGAGHDKQEIPGQARNDSENARHDEILRYAQDDRVGYQWNVSCQKCRERQCPCGAVHPGRVGHQWNVSCQRSRERQCPCGAVHPDRVGRKRSGAR